MRVAGNVEFTGYISRPHEERDEWVALLADHVDSTHDVPAPTEWSPTRPAPVLLKGRPNVLCQTLGSIEGLGSSRRRANNDLKMAAGVRGAHAVVDVTDDKVAHLYESEWQSRGTAVIAVDATGAGQN